SGRASGKTMAEQTVFELPDLGEGLAEAEIVSWHVAVGDDVAVDQPVVEVETAKASVEVPIPFAGTVAVLHGAPGDVVAVGSPLISVSSGAPGDDETSGHVLVGYGTRNGSRTRRQRSRTAATPVPAEATSRTVAVVSPLVRRLARESGLE